MGRGLDTIYGAGMVLASPMLAWKALRHGKYRRGWSERMGRGPFVGHAKNPTLLIHAVSVGEVNATRHLVAQLRKRQPRIQIVLSTTTDTGLERARSVAEATAQPFVP